MPACSKETAEPLTDAESKFVGTWVLDEIGYMDFSKGDYLTTLRYPSTSKVFNTLYEQYIDKTEIIFNDIKKGGKMSGTLCVGDQTYDFSWHGWEKNETVLRADFVKQFNLLSYSATTDKTVSCTIYYGIIMDDNKLYFNPVTVMKYVFTKG